MKARNIAALRGASTIAARGVDRGMYATRESRPPRRSRKPSGSRQIKGSRSRPMPPACRSTTASPARTTLRASSGRSERRKRELFDVTGKRIGKHYAGPTWESYDGSKVVGEVKARSDGPDATRSRGCCSSAKSTSGDGVLGQTASIQRARHGRRQGARAGLRPDARGQRSPRALHGQRITSTRRSGKRQSGPARCTAGPM